MTNATLRGKPDAGNPHVRFDEGEVASAKPRRGSLLYNVHNQFGCLCSIFALVVGGASFEALGDAVIKKSGQSWTSTSTNAWQGPVPAFGPGVAVTFSGNGGQSIYLGTNVTIGSFTIPATVTPSSKAYYQVYPNRYRDTTTVDPTWGNYKWGEHGYTLTFDSGSDEPAVLGALAPVAGNIYRFYTHIPIRMASDLKIVHNGLTRWPGGSSGEGENVSLGVLGPISDDGEKHLLITEGPIQSNGVYPGIVLAGENTFTGDVDVRAWTRLMTTDGDQTKGRQLGYAKTVYVTNDWGVLDLNGNVMATDHHLVLGGYNVKTSAIGKISSSYGNMNATAVWKGPVTIASPTAIGGVSASYPVNQTESPLRIEGDIDDSAGHTLRLQAANGLTLAGTNTFNGRVYVGRGTVTFEKPEGFGGTGRLQMADDATYRMTAADQPDFSTIVYTNTCADHTLRLKLDGDFTYEPKAGFTNFTYFIKSGRGTLIWSKPNKGIGGNNQMDFWCCEGDTVFDYTKSDTPRLSGHSFFATIGVANGGRVTLKTKTNTKTLCDLGIGDWSTGTFTVEGGREVYVMSPRASLSSVGVLSLNVGVQGLRSQAGIALTAADSMPGTWGEGFIWSNRTWMATARTTSQGSYCGPFTAYTNDWTRGKCFIDVTPELLEDPIPADFSVAAIRFDTPFDDDTVTLNLSGTNDITGGMILVTPQFGANKTIRLKGGALDRPTAGPIRFVSFATNLTVVVESDLVQTNRANAVSFGVYGCTVQFKGKSDLNGSLGIVNGVLEIWDNEIMGGLVAAANANKAKWISFNQGGWLKTHGDFTLRKTVGSYYCVPTFATYYGGGGLDVADGTLANGETQGEMVLFDGGEFTKRGAGHFNWNGNLKRSLGVKQGVAGTVGHYRFTEGRVTMGGSGTTNFDERQNVITVMSNVVITGGNAFSVNLGGANGGGHITDSGCKTVFSVGEGGVTFDVNGTSRTIGDANSIGDLSGYVLNPAADFYSGSDDVTFTNSSTTAANVDFLGIGLPRLTGRIVNAAARYVANGGSRWINFPNGTYEVPTGLTSSFWQIMDGYQSLHFGAVTGGGTLLIYARNNYADPVMRIGRDADETVDFDGVLQTRSLAEGNHSSGWILKTGSNRMRLTNPNGSPRGVTRIADGDILIACEPSGGQSGALGFTSIYVGHPETPADGVARLLTDGAYTITNNIKVLADAPATARCVLGGASATAASTFKGKVRLYRDVELYSAGGKVTFEGQVMSGDGENHNIAKTGPGEVVLKQDLALGDAYQWAGGSLAVDGAVTVADGTPFTVDLSLLSDVPPADPAPIVLLSAKNGITGRFTFPQTLPGHWTLRQTKTSVKLSWGVPGTLILVR